MSFGLNISIVVVTNLLKLERCIFFSRSTTVLGSLKNCHLSPSTLRILFVLVWGIFSSVGTFSMLLLDICDNEFLKKTQTFVDINNWIVYKWWMDMTCFYKDKIRVWNPLLSSCNRWWTRFPQPFNFSDGNTSCVMTINYGLHGKLLVVMYPTFHLMKVKLVHDWCSMFLPEMWNDFSYQILITKIFRKSTTESLNSVVIHQCLTK